jgi:DNA helicase-2/ATP-dependent DNA helicase PcrA
MTDNRERHVAKLAASEGCDTSKEGVLDALTRDGSFDVQACPGSGKTTTVATKIVVLLEEWRRNGGICVLTHTNVAREEIQKKLRASTTGRAALDSPHFVGTIQSFIDTFLALPDLRAKGITVEQIDNDAFASAADYEYSRGGYPYLRGWLKGRTRDGQPENKSYRAVEYNANTSELKFGSQETGFKNEESHAYQELAKLKGNLSARGIFRHGDMYHFSNRYLDEFPWAVAALRSRFPVVIIDEMQDTSAKQDILLNRLFPPDVTEVQRFGDENQKIFDMDDSGDEVGSFPRSPIVNLGVSRRFGKFIANRIATIAPRRQTILGDDTVPGGRHTVLLFDEHTVLDVIPHFARIAADELHDLNELPVVKAVGHRKRPSEGGGKFPNHVGNYVEGFVPDAVAAITGRDGLRLRVERAKSDMARDPMAGPKQVMIAVRMILSLWGILDRPQQIVVRIMQNNKSRRRLGAAIMALLATVNPDPPTWNILIGPLLSVLEDAVGVAAPPKAKAFAEWVDVHKASAVPISGNAARTLAIHVDVQTIHSIKGENHHATLVLETQYKKHDVSMILHYMADPASRKKGTLGTEVTMHHRRMFVAMSRPRRLLCMAAAAAHVPAELREALKAQGWDVIDLTKGATPIE